MKHLGIRTPSRTLRPDRLRSRLRLEALEDRNLLDVGDTLATALATMLGPPPGTYALTNEFLGDGTFGDRDVDIYRFQVGAPGSPVRARTNGPCDSGGMDTILRLFDSSGTQLAVNDDAGSLCSEINFEI